MYKRIKARVSAVIYIQEIEARIKRSCLYKRGYAIYTQEGGGKCVSRYRCTRGKWRNVSINKWVKLSIYERVGARGRALMPIQEGSGEMYL